MAYTTATIAQIDENSAGIVTGIKVDFTGNASEQPHPEIFSPGGRSVAEESLAARQWAHNQVIPGLNNRVALSNAPGLAVGVVIPPPPAPDPPTAKSVWQGKDAKLRAMQESKLAMTANGATPNAAFTTELTALATDVAATYQTGFAG